MARYELPCNPDEFVKIIKEAIRMEYLGDLEKAAELWDRIDRKNDAEACRNIIAANRRGEQYRKRLQEDMYLYESGEITRDELGPRMDQHYKDIFK